MKKTSELGREKPCCFSGQGHKGPVYAAQFAKASNLLASGSFDQSVRIWDVQTQREVCNCFSQPYSL